MDVQNLSGRQKKTPELYESMRLGVCHLCRKPKEVGRLNHWYCRACNNVKREGRKLKVRDLELSTTPWACERPCRACGHVFHSPDRRRITLCAKCCRLQDYAEDNLPSEYARYAMEPGDLGGMYHKLARPVGRQINSIDQNTIQAEQRAQDYVGMPYHRLSRTEIAAQYTPERISALLARATRNTAAMYTELVQL